VHVITELPLSTRVGKDASQDTNSSEHGDFKNGNMMLRPKLTRQLASSKSLIANFTIPIVYLVFENGKGVGTLQIV
jgi:hypothetical protein